MQGVLLVSSKPVQGEEEMSFGEVVFAVILGNFLFLIILCLLHDTGEDKEKK